MIFLLFLLCYSSFIPTNKMYVFQRRRVYSEWSKQRAASGRMLNSPGFCESKNEREMRDRNSFRAWRIAVSLEIICNLNAWMYDDLVYVDIR